ncbi:hypothetical protein D9758_007669 [Tetrapyrgos nigripes]|uniref:Uncharacterized protein n=1 Tax=Tetrapyrgos nigripes TaxID=182062 RepID=A0A8H5G5B1_9AGAR|nr:hypothetical protein D9758_007669 [Tetrapyrgos nigripes]
MQFNLSTLVSLFVFVSAVVALPAPVPVANDVEARGPPVQADCLGPLFLVQVPSFLPSVCLPSSELIDLNSRRTRSAVFGLRLNHIVLASVIVVIVFLIPSSDPNTSPHSYATQPQVRTGPRLFGSAGLHHLRHRHKYLSRSAAPRV